VEELAKTKEVTKGKAGRYILNKILIHNLKCVQGLSDISIVVAQLINAASDSLSLRDSLLALLCERFKSLLLSFDIP
jgi:hypothetical protein